MRHFYPMTLPRLLQHMVVCFLRSRDVLCLTFSFDFAVNCMYWEQRFPRLLTSTELLELRSRGQSRLLEIADITCDKGGSVEFLKKYSSIQNPFYRFTSQTVVTSGSFWFTAFFYHILHILVHGLIVRNKSL